MEAAELISKEILAAKWGRQLLEPASERYEFGLVDAYVVQRRLLESRVAAGERQVGWKIGYTSQAMREQMGVAEPNFGFLTDRMVLDSPAELPPGCLQPRVEPEVAVVLAHEIRPSMSLAEIASSGHELRCALEVVDPVWRDYRFTLRDNTADGSSAAYAILGPAISLDRDLAAINVVLSEGGKELATGSTRAVMGHPLEALRWLAGALAAQSLALKAGDLVLTGGITRAMPLRSGLEATFQGVGSVSVRWPTQ
ncbi:2-keto-4-pentenoate hydratase [Blastococcus tunisiensis]|uniref:2-oxopent-4-enoate/cis-2-oxohex-4-enoate hydratase n=1 Tax=Blastococcus tunisiensis TaxID=1798228 RepID=A0A1I2JLR4_9ACTN|nr:fumarylacetoacetate hydrolase family protein [Blastococcus sp. DSM 46838]SFF54823.1 2-oxopent-4-enoate/cis-2-oxohex-4-enoate hydratase [Blastococcus sp. DSM 46838]